MQATFDEARERQLSQAMLMFERAMRPLYRAKERLFNMATSRIVMTGQEMTVEPVFTPEQRKTLDLLNQLIETRTDLFMAEQGLGDFR